MKKIIDFTNKEEVQFTDADLSILVHGREHSGASLFSITLAAIFHVKKKKLCIFTAYPMAKEEFLNQVQDPQNVFYLENQQDFEKASEFQTIIIQSGNIDLFVKIIDDPFLMKDRIIFIKNIETINKSIFELVIPYPFIVSGDLELNSLQSGFKDFNCNTKILFNSIQGEEIPSMDKYQAFLKNKFGGKIMAVS